MKSWLSQFRISIALDDRKPITPDLAAKSNKSDEVRRFALDSEKLANGLKSQIPESDASPFLHSAIMQKVRAADETAVAEPRLHRWKLLAPAGLSVTVLAGAILLINGKSIQPNPANVIEPSSLASASSALEKGGQIMGEIPSVAVAPLSDEMTRLKLDASETGKFLLASLP